ncbi:type II toxin-antitoxin system RelE/ParE family toxin [Bradyrhizobium altum]|uniref:type II toxin-antitoxin system RelE/ParE family toxin n=1 Tax=Bradyrhizobium altum TaxID=1571202 RepID=UPI002898F766|nr:type II toxin-antitoxin system RelE/ParE family toxin [Bradyrhizobium altum]
MPHSHVVADHNTDTYRGVYTVEYAEGIYVVDIFQKKSKRGVETPKEDIDRIVGRLKRLREDRATPSGQEKIAAPDPASPGHWRRSAVTRLPPGTDRPRGSSTPLRQKPIAANGRLACRTTGVSVTPTTRAATSAPGYCHACLLRIVPA